MIDSDEDAIPDTETRRRSYRQLTTETRLPNAPVDATDEAKKREAARKRAAHGAEGLTLPLQAEDSSQVPGNPPQTQRRVSNRETGNGPEPVFNTPLGNSVAFSAELPAGIKGVTEEDSYLFITEEVSAEGLPTNRGWRAFIVSKENPKEQREISLSDVNFDTVSRHEFRAKLGGEHEFVRGMGLASVDGKSVVAIDAPERMQLVRERRVMTTTTGDGVGVSHATCLTGNSWTLLQKNYETGRITKFTQEGTSGFGRLEIIQGDSKNSAWLTEIDGPVISSKEHVRVPSELREWAVNEEQGRIAIGDDPSSSHVRSLSALIDPSDREKDARERKSMVDAMNAGVGQGKDTRPQSSFPKP